MSIAADVSDLQQRLQQMTSLYHKEKTEKEHTIIAYRRYVRRMDKFKHQSNGLQYNMTQDNINSSSSSSSMLIDSQSN